MEEVRFTVHNTVWKLSAVTRPQNEDDYHILMREQSKSWSYFLTFPLLIVKTNSISK